MGRVATVGQHTVERGGSKKDVRRKWAVAQIWGEGGEKSMCYILGAHGLGL